MLRPTLVLQSNRWKQRCLQSPLFHFSSHMRSYWIALLLNLCGISHTNFNTFLLCFKICNTKHLKCKIEWLEWWLSTKHPKCKIKRLELWVHSIGSSLFASTFLSKYLCPNELSRLLLHLLSNVSIVETLQHLILCCLQSIKDVHYFPT